MELQRFIEQSLIDFLCSSDTRVVTHSSSLPRRFRIVHVEDVCFFVYLKKLRIRPTNIVSIIQIINHRQGMVSKRAKCLLRVNLLINTHSFIVYCVFFLLGPVLY